MENTSFHNHRILSPHVGESSAWKFLVPIASIEDPKHQHDYHKDHPAGFRTHRASGQPLRLPAGFKKVANGVLAGILP